MTHRVWAAQRELPLQSRGKRLFVTVTSDGVAMRRKGAREVFRAGWLPIAKLAMGDGNVFPITGTEGGKQ
jgi:hypothetical protein